MNKPLALEKEHLSPQGPLWETWRGVRLSETLRDGKGAFCNRDVSLYGSSVREHGGRSPLLETLKVK